MRVRVCVIDALSLTVVHEFEFCVSHFCSASQSAQVFFPEDLV